uniref:C->U-editing enzyme APOBEC-1 n=1 Tax=Chelydra serpentina TaxID=8475 RepID=A0A8C3TLY6_CHESE
LAFMENYDPSVLPKETYLLYEIKWSNSKRPWQSCCHSTHTEHAEIHFIEDVFQEQRSDPSVHCSITWYMSWSPCADCCRAIRDFLKEQPNVNLVIYVARIYWHKEENNRQGLRDLVSSGVNVHIMSLPGNTSQVISGQDRTWGLWSSVHEPLPHELKAKWLLAKAVEQTHLTLSLFT